MPTTTTGPTAALRTVERIVDNSQVLGRQVTDWDVQAARETIELLHSQLEMLSDALPSGGQR